MPTLTRLNGWEQLAWPGGSSTSRKAWGPERAGAIVAAAEATLAIWGNDGLDFEALAADIAAEASIALEVSEQIALLDRRIHDLYLEADPDGIVRSNPRGR
jgi:hypothetical protein